MRLCLFSMQAKVILQVRCSVYHRLCLLLLLFLPLVPLYLNWMGDRQVVLADTRYGTVRNLLPVRAPSSILRMFVWKVFLSFVKDNNSPKQRCILLEELTLVDDPLVCSFVFTDTSEPFLVVTKLLVEVESL